MKHTTKNDAAFTCSNEAYEAGLDRIAREVDDAEKAAGTGPYARDDDATDLAAIEDANDDAEHDERLAGLDFGQGEEW